MSDQSSPEAARDTESDESTVAVEQHPQPGPTPGIYWDANCPECGRVWSSSWHDTAVEDAEGCCDAE